MSGGLDFTPVGIERRNLTRHAFGEGLLALCDTVKIANGVPLGPPEGYTLEPDPAKVDCAECLELIHS